MLVTYNIKNKYHTVSTILKFIGQIVETEATNCYSLRNMFNILSGYMI